jgi:integrase/recombinase XerD
MVVSDYTKKFLERLEKVYNDPAHPIDNLRQIKLFLKKMNHNGASKETVKYNCAGLTIVSKWCTKPFSELDELAILEFFDYLKNYRFVRRGKEQGYSAISIQTHKAVLHKFLKSIKITEFHDLFKDKVKRKKKIDRSTLLTPEEIDTLIDTAMNARDKAIIATLFESGARRGELLSTKIKDVKFDSAGAKLHFPEGKTGERTVRLVFASQYLRHWIDSHPLKDIPEAHLFISLQKSRNKDTGKLEYTRISDMGLYEQIQKIAEKAGIKKRANPHNFRHACASMLADQMKEQPLKAHLGWTPGSDMLDVYIHDPYSENAMLEMYGMQPLEAEEKKLRVNRCPRCGEINRKKNIFCWKCGTELIVDYATAQKLANIFEMAEGIVKDPYSREGIEAGLKKLQDFLSSQTDISWDKDKAEKEEKENED